LDAHENISHDDKFLNGTTQSGPASEGQRFDSIDLKREGDVLSALLLDYSLTGMVDTMCVNQTSH